MSTRPTHTRRDRLAKGMHQFRAASCVFAPHTRARSEHTPTIGTNTKLICSPLTRCSPSSYNTALLKHARCNSCQLAHIPAYTRAYQRIPARARAYSGTLAHTRAYPRIPAHTRAYPRIPARTRAYSGTLAHTRAYSRIPTHTRAYPRILAHTRAYSRILAHTRAYPRIPAHISAHTRAYSRTPAHTRPSPSPMPAVALSRHSAKFELWRRLRMPDFYTSLPSYLMSHVGIHMPIYIYIHTCLVYDLECVRKLRFRLRFASWVPGK